MSRTFPLALRVIVLCIQFELLLLPISAIADSYDAISVKNHLSDVTSRYHELPLMVTSEWTSFASGGDTPTAWRRETYARDSGGRKRVTFESGTFSGDRTRVANPLLFRHMWYNGVDSLTSLYQSEILVYTLHEGIYPPPGGVRTTWNPLTFMRLALLEIIDSSLKDQRTVSVVEEGKELHLVTQVSDGPNSLTYSAQIRPDHDWAVTFLRASRNKESVFEKSASYEQYGGRVWAPRLSRWHSQQSAERFELVSLVLDKAELPDLSDIRLEPRALLADFRAPSKGDFVIGSTGSVSDRSPFERLKKPSTTSPDNSGRRWWAFMLANCVVILCLIVLVVRRRSVP